MSLIDLPAQKEILWHKLRCDLITLVPYFRDKDVLLCPACCRPVRFDDLSVEHILPKQAVALDPMAARQAISQNERSGLTLLCRKPLTIKGKRVPGNGCNGWKGKHFDSCLRDLANSNIQTLTTRHQVALYVAGYLALFREFGYQVALSAAGTLSRKQFFHANDFLKIIPWNCQMILAGEPRSEFVDDDKQYWREPFKITVDRSTAIIVFRHMSFRIPISRDPCVPIAKILPYAPARFAFRPDHRFFFD